MELEGKIIQVLDARGGTSARTGAPWKVQSYVLEVSNGGSYPRRMVFDVFGEDKIAMFNIQEGQEVKVSFDIDAHEYQGRWYNSIRAWKVEPPTATAPMAETPGVAPTAAATPQPAAPVANEAPATPFDEGLNEGSTDDLPF
ncbi:MAG: DUF3127 domain-containing protein [Bacteroidaceae bacterium]|nr:DUF3127 domain-containing protein [Bacteroidaceae bacterium]